MADSELKNKRVLGEGKASQSKKLCVTVECAGCFTEITEVNLSQRDMSIWGNHGFPRKGFLGHPRRLIVPAGAFALCILKGW